MAKKADKKKSFVPPSLASLTSPSGIWEVKRTDGSNTRIMAPTVEAVKAKLAYMSTPFTKGTTIKYESQFAFCLHITQHKRTLAQKVHAPVLPLKNSTKGHCSGDHGAGGSPIGSPFRFGYMHPAPACTPPPSTTHHIYRNISRHTGCEKCSRVR